MARSLRAKFENWTTGSVERDNNNHKNHNGAYDLPDDYTPQTDTAKNLKAKFESFRSDASSRPVIEKRKPRVNRFVVSPPPAHLLLLIHHSSIHPLIRPILSLSCFATDTHSNSVSRRLFCRRCASCMCVCARIGCR